MQLKSLELWEDIEIKLIEFKNRNDLDQILLQRFDSLINHFNGNIASGTQFETIDEVKILIDAMSSVSFFKIRQIDKKDTENLKILVEDLSLLEKVLIQEKKLYKENIFETRERFPNIDNDKSLKIFDKVN